MKAINLGIIKYAPKTRLTLTLESAANYDMASVSVNFEIKVDDTLFSISEDADNIVIAGQNILLNVSPLASDGTNTFGEIVALRGSVPFNLDLSQSGSSIVDWRLQGEILNLPEHGTFNEDD